MPPRCSGIGMPPSISSLPHPTAIKRRTPQHQTSPCTHFNLSRLDLDHDLTIVEYKAGFNNTNIQETMQRLIVMERKILRINMAINKYILAQEGRSGRNTTMTEGIWSDTLTTSISQNIHVPIHLSSYHPCHVPIVRPPRACLGEHCCHVHGAARIIMTLLYCSCKRRPRTFLLERKTSSIMCVKTKHRLPTVMGLQANESTAYYLCTDFSRNSFSFLVFVVTVDARVIQLGSPLARIARTRS